MHREKRLEVAGGFHHVYARGNQRDPIFLDDLDYAAHLRRLAKTVGTFGWVCHGFCLMPNHFHLLIETPEPNRGAGMHVLNLSYARWFNWRHRRVGHVFQGPYGLTPVTRDAHLMELCRYIVLNPVRAFLVAKPEDWPWSSYRATAGLEPALPFLTVERIQDYFAQPGRSGAEEFRDFVAAAVATLDLAA